MKFVPFPTCSLVASLVCLSSAVAVDQPSLFPRPDTAPTPAFPEVKIFQTPSTLSDLAWQAHVPPPPFQSALVVAKAEEQTKTTTYSDDKFVVKPDSSVDYKLAVKQPDGTVDYRLIVKNPDTLWKK